MTYSIFEDTLAELTYPQLEAAARRGVPVLLPTGVVEEHGPHLPLSTDVIGSQLLCRLARRRVLEQGGEALVAPPYYWGINHVTGAFPGSFRTRPEIAAGLLEDIFETLVTGGFEQVLVVNHHGDRAHNQMIADVIAGQHERGRTGVRWLDHGGTARRLGFTGEEPQWAIYDPPEEWRSRLSAHGGRTETALVARYAPQLVDWDVIDELPEHQLSPEQLAEWRKGDEHAKAITPHGYFGRPRTEFDDWRFYDHHGRAIGDAVLALTASA